MKDHGDAYASVVAALSAPDEKTTKFTRESEDALRKTPRPLTKQFGNPAFALWQRLDELDAHRLSGNQAGILEMETALMLATPASLQP